jgi:hypothetical protein
MDLPDNNEQQDPVEENQLYLPDKNEQHNTGQENQRGSPDITQEHDPVGENQMGKPYMSQTNPLLLSGRSGEDNPWTSDDVNNKNMIAVMKERLKHTGDETKIKDWEQIRPLIGKTITTNLFNNQITMRSHFSRTKASPPPDYLGKKKTLRNRFLSLFQREIDHSDIEKFVITTLESLNQDIPDTSIYSRAKRFFGSKNQPDLESIKYYSEQKKKISDALKDIKKEKLLDPLTKLGIQDRPKVTSLYNDLRYISENRIMGTERLIAFLENILDRIMPATSNILKPSTNEQILSQPRTPSELLDELVNSLKEWKKFVERLSNKQHEINGGTRRCRPKRNHPHYNRAKKTRHVVRKVPCVRKTRRR